MEQVVLEQGGYYGDDSCHPFESALEVELIRPAGCGGEEREESRISPQDSCLSRWEGCSEMERL